ncbi:hypothetical protein ACN2MM_00025 [Alkalilimnicola ehrlichii MLHE-1]|uniref:Glycosyl transferase family 28 C-terminal domain-containing protein n=1 Tax=Alkalilimnicola ehrlichii (strain ATCC BAA-1101 / DSM 17681 / MLHE-1) TaxID=187272 RepID=Q0A4U8_ALKEH|nr:hypothetical protein [Alkalilimnicola ehrlichii]ABI58139.1 hypothetical protein Mlg_2799 [Alkalilimnicola ehrlichii MLHE-1]
MVEEVASPVVLFVPISGREGSGEYYRLLTLAKGLSQRCPDWSLQFVVNRSARVERPAFIRVHELEGTPKRNPNRLSNLIQQLRPQVVVFDSTLRPWMLRAARSVGARTVYVSWRPRTRRLGFARKHLRLLDEHWLVGDPGDLRLTFGERCRLMAAGSRTAIRFFSALMPLPDQQAADTLLRRLAPGADGYVFFCSGGGGTSVGGRPSSEIFQRAARLFHARTGVPVVFVAGPLSSHRLSDQPGRLELRSVPSEVFVALVARARLAVSGGGSMIQQVLSARVPCVGVAAGGNDQPQRIENLAAQGRIVPADADDEGIASAVEALHADPDRQARILANGAERAYANGTPEAVDRLIALIPERP